LLRFLLGTLALAISLVAPSVVAADAVRVVPGQVFADGQTTAATRSTSGG
jgi:hypothetical protein